MAVIFDVTTDPTSDVSLNRLVQHSELKLARTASRVMKSTFLVDISVLCHRSFHVGQCLVDLRQVANGRKLEQNTTAKCHDCEPDLGPSA
jgi:hypothetical protein